MTYRSMTRALLLLVVGAFLLIHPPVLAQTTDLVVWGLFAPGSPYGDTMQRLTEEFNRENPDVRVTYEAVADLRDKLQVSIAAGTGPDMSIVAGGILPNRSDLPKLLAPLSSYYERDGVAGDFVPGSLTWFSWEDESYAAPLSLDFNFPLVINNDLFQSAGVEYTSVESVEDIWDVSSKLTRYTQDGEVEVAAMRPWDLYGYNQGLITWVRALGGQLSDGKRYTFENPAVGEALQWLLDYGDTFGRTPLPLDPNRIAMSPAVLSRIQTYAESTHVDTDLRLLPFPAKKAGERSIWLGGQWLAITRNSKHRDEAWRFVKWVTTSDEAAEISNGVFISGALAPHRDGLYIRNEVTMFDRLRNEYMRLAEHVGVLEHPTIYYWNDLNQLVQRVVLDKSLPVESAIIEYNETLNARLNPFLQGE